MNKEIFRIVQLFTWFWLGLLIFKKNSNYFGERYQ